MNETIEQQYQYQYNGKVAKFNLNINVYPQEDLERLIYDYLCVSEQFTQDELEVIGKLSGESFMLNLSYLTKKTSHFKN